MNNKNILKIAFGTLLFGLSIVACKKEEPAPTPNNDSDTSTASENSLAESTFGNVVSIADQAASGTLILFPTSNEEQSLSLEKASCATVTHDSTSSPKTITIDFGTANCLCTDGRNRRGIINVSYEGLYRDSAAVHTITFNNYFVNDHQVEGTKTVTNNGRNSNGNLNYTIAINGQITKPNDAGIFTYISNRNREWTAGESTFSWSDDIYSITGSSSGTNSAGASYTAEITTALIKEISCRWISSGILDYTPSDKPTRTINYGNTGCDYNATCTINGYEFNIILQ